MKMCICTNVLVFSAGATRTLYKLFMLNRLKFNTPASCNTSATIVRVYV